MNWNGGSLSKTRNSKKKKKSLSEAQKRYFIRAQAQSETPRQFRADLEFSTLEHARKEELPARKRSPPNREVDPHAGSSKASEFSFKEGRAVIPPSSSSSPASPFSCDYIKDDSLEYQKRKLLAMNDWCGLQKPLPVQAASESTEKRVSKRQLSDSSEAYSPLESLAGITDRRKPPEARNLHNAEEKRYRANKRQQSESSRRIGLLEGRSEDGSRTESSPRHRDGPFCSALKRMTTPSTSHYLNSDENLFADELTKSQPLFHPSPLRRIAYDWSDIRSDVNLPARSPLDARSLTDSTAEIEPKMTNHHRHPWVSDLSQVRSTNSSRLSAELTAGAVPDDSSDYMSQAPKRSLLKKATYAPVRPELNSENLTRFLLEHENLEPIYQYSDIKAQSHSAKSVQIAATDSCEYDPRAQQEFCTPSRLLAQSDLYGPTTAANVQEESIATGEPGAVACSSTSNGVIGNLASSTVQLPRTIKCGELLSPDSGWRDFVIGSANGEMGDTSPSIRHCIHSQIDLQSPDSRRDKKRSSPLSSPHQFNFLCAEPIDEPSPDQQNPHEPQGILSSPHQFNFLCSEPIDEPSPDQQNPHEPQGILSGPHRFSSISSDQSTSTQSTAHAACSLPDITQEMPSCSLEHPPILREQLASSHDRDSTEELEHRAERFVKPAFIFTKPARFVGERVVGVSSSTGTGEYKRRSTASSLGQVQSEEEEEVEDIED